MKKANSTKTAIVVGFGNVGQLISKYLIKKGFQVYVYDDNTKAFTSKENRKITNHRFFHKINPQKPMLPVIKPEFAIISPGIAPSHQFLKTLARHHIPMLDEIEFTAQFISKPIIAITGTNGKSTATVLLAKFLSTAGYQVFYGGNLAPGKPFISSLFQKPKDYYVIEISSFQLQRCYKFHPYIAIITNITADHLDRHQSLADYQKTKLRIAQNQTPNDFCILNYDDKVSMAIKDQIPSQHIYFSGKDHTNGAYLINDQVIYYNNEKIIDLSDIKLFGKHYLDSILSSISAAKLLSVDNKSITKVLQQFKGLPHRLEVVRRLRGVTYINNSMCTNPTAASATLRSFGNPVILITGGKEKNLPIDEYLETIIQRAKYVVLFGENKTKLATRLNRLHYHNYQTALNLRDAVKIAQKQAQKNDTILFSPGFASFDAYQNFQERGHAFIKIVRQLK